MNYVERMRTYLENARPIPVPAALAPGRSYESDAAWDRAADLRREAWLASPFWEAFESLSGRLPA